MDPGLLSTLRVHNPWLDRPDQQQSLIRATIREPFIPRIKGLEVRPGRVELVVGPRQAGKSTWIRHFLAGLDEPVLILHAEETRVRELGRSPALALEALGKLLTPSTILFFEEVQHLADASLFLKGLVDLDPRRRVVATGSSSLTLRARTRESMAGRVRRTLLLPLSIAEIASQLPPALAPAVRDARLLEAWERLIVTGGYPEAWLEPDPSTLLHHLVEAFVLRDVSDLERVESPAAFRRLIELAAADCGNLVNLSAWAAACEVSRNTIVRYLDIAEDAHLLRRVTPFVGGKRAELTGAPKLHFLDPGLRNAVFGGFEPAARRADRGALWETTVYSELLKRLPLLDEVMYWRSKSGAEIDFVVRREGRLLAIEVKAGPLSQPTISRSARSFLEAYQPACLGVINASLRLDTTEGGVPVRFRRPGEIGELLAVLEAEPGQT